MLIELKDSLATFAALPAATRRTARLKIQWLLSGDVKPPAHAIIASEDAQMHVPMPIGDYTDFCIA